jgi:hypothetical protein
MDVFHEGDPCPGQIKEKRKMVNRIPDPVSYFIMRVF